MITLRNAVCSLAKSSHRRRRFAAFAFDSFWIRGQIPQPAFLQHLADALRMTDVVPYAHIIIVRVFHICLLVEKFHDKTGFV